MKKKLVSFLAVFFVAQMVIGCTQNDGTKPAALPPNHAVEPTYEPVELLVGAAMSLRNVTAELANVFMSENPHITLEFTYASSGVLQSQIEEGAPIDVFMSAADVHVRNLEERGLIDGESRHLVTNAVVLIAPNDSDIEIAEFADIADDSVRLIALGDPDSVPIGAFARDIFTALGIADEVYEKAVLANESRQIITWVEMGEVDAGVAFLTDAIITDLVRIVEVADSDLHTPSVNSAAIIHGTPHLAAAQLFIDFLFTNEAMQIFEQHGFNRP